MLRFLKLVGATLLAFGGFSLAVGIGAALAALSAVLGTALLGGTALLVIILMVKELFEGKP